MTYLEFEFDHEIRGAQWHPIPKPSTLRWLILRQSYMFIRILSSVSPVPHNLMLERNNEPHLTLNSQ